MNRVISVLPFEVIVLLSFVVVSLAQPACLAEEYLHAGECSWNPSGVFCFKSTTGEHERIYVMRYADGKMDTLFVKEIRHSMPPICLTNAVVVVSSDGCVYKLDLKGNFLFGAKLNGFKGLSVKSGLASDSCIFLTESLLDTKKKDWVSRLYLVDITGKSPAIKATFDIVTPWKVTETCGDIIVIGPENTMRFKIPNDCY